MSFEGTCFILCFMLLSVFQKHKRLLVCEKKNFDNWFSKQVLITHIDGGAT